MKKLVIAGKVLPKHKTIVETIDFQHGWPGDAFEQKRPWWANDSDIIKARKEQRAMEDIDNIPE